MERVNSSKLRNMRALLEGMQIELISPLEHQIELPPVREDWNTPWDNAKEKALAYFRTTGIPSIGLDSGLFLEGLSKSQQPGIYVRRVNGRTLSDKEFIEYYSGIARQHGGKVKARFVNGLCVVIDEKRVKCAGGLHISTDWFWIVEEPHVIQIEGFPMDSIAVDPYSGKYWVEADLKNEQKAKGEGLQKGIRQFFSELIDGNYESRITEENGI